MLLFQVQPAFFYTRQDVFTWLFMQTGLHKLLLNNMAGFIMMDTLFYSMPLIYLFIYKLKHRLSPIAAILMLLINLAYIQCYTLYPINSIESYIAWLLFPVVFIPSNRQTFLLLFRGLRYFFLFFFASAAVWKLAQGGIFNPSEMSGILLYQHNQLLTGSPGYWLTNVYLFLIQHKTLSYLLYLGATLLEVAFVVGFFTTRYDRLLAVLVIVFLIADHFIMRIPYYEISALLLTLLLKYPENKRVYA